MPGERWTTESVTARIEAIDPGGPVLEVAAALRTLHRQLVRDLGDREARECFDRALATALARRRGPLAAA